jgi:transposase-like protein
MEEDYPKTLLEFERRFASDADCRAYLEQLRWPKGFQCPACAAREGWRMGNGLWLCRQCRRQVSVKAGTIFQDSRLPLTLWFRAIWYVTSQKNGASAKNIQRILGLGSYQTAWTWLQKLRRAMVRPGREPLQGIVEVDETFIGAVGDGHPGRGGKKALVVIAAEVQGQGIGRIRLRQIPNASTGTLRGFIEDSVALGSVLRTDGWKGYEPIGRCGYHRQIQLANAQQEVLPHVHQVASLVKRWLLGTHQGAVRPEHLAYYLDEFTFRFNRRTSASRGKLFYRLVEQAVQVAPHPYRQLIHHHP